VCATLNIVVNDSQCTLDALFSALSDPTRREILSRLAEGESSVTELADPFPISLPAVSRHLRVLESAGLVAREKDGRVHRLRLVADPLLDGLEWIAVFGRFWEQRLDSLDRFLATRAESEEAP
jgi:DNA-binding transcriptional ArsR family regulator